MDPTSEVTLAEPLSGESWVRDPGGHVGRYELRGRVGGGGMGVVYAAYDPGLDRRVAVKLLIAPRKADHESRSSGRRRMIREAQAMARLAHPNVVAVYDVGMHEQQVFVAMEFIDGVTLKVWNREAHSIAEILDVFAAAARGLQAAHDVGLVHRDFKPDNVMLTASGQVRVTDFGLARRAGSDASAAEGATTGAARSLEDTQTRGRTGTPAYMSPEQHAGLSITPSSDQFSFCVALYEALYGERPFVGDCAAALAFETLDGNVRPAPGSSRVPAWLRAIVLRGLSVDPAARWPSMRALTDALTRRRQRASLRRLAIAVVIALAVSGWALVLSES